MLKTVMDAVNKGLTRKIAETNDLRVRTYDVYISFKIGKSRRHVDRRLD